MDIGEEQEEIEVVPSVAPAEPVVVPVEEPAPVEEPVPA